ncbi:MAG: hypothetical protein M5R36_26125 [Deltaproteobacteria bacterium]|nr:hypothetical protein [Deltaproteobacteria bacterium]
MLRAFVLILLVALALPVWALAEPGYQTADTANSPAEKVQDEPPVRYRLVMKADFHVRENPDNEKLVVTMPLPSDSDAQKVFSWSVTPKPDREIVSKYGYRFFEFDLGPGYPGERLLVKYEADLELYKTRYEIDPATVGTLDDIPADIRADYTADGKFYGLKTKTIQRLSPRPSATKPTLISKRGASGITCARSCSTKATARRCPRRGRCVSGMGRVRSIRFPWWRCAARRAFPRVTRRARCRACAATAKARSTCPSTRSWNFSCRPTAG